MMRIVLWSVAFMLVWTGGVAVAQAPEALDEEQPGDEIFEAVAILQEMGMDEDEALLMAIMMSGEGDMAQILPLIMGLGGLHGDMEDFFFMNLFSKGAGGQAPAPQPISWRDGEHVFILEEGVLYKINSETMEVEGRLPYKQKKSGILGTLRALRPMMARGMEKAQMTSCLSNMKQICLGALMYAQDWDEMLPGENWVDDLQPYLKNTQIYICPSRPWLAVGYALNEQIAGAAMGDIVNPSQTILFFEAGTDEEITLGGADEVPEDGVHNHGIVCGYVDGHAKWVTVEEARTALAQDPFGG